MSATGTSEASCRREGRTQLLALYARIDERTGAVLSELPGWPCRRGCDGCCRRLASPPSIPRLEWKLLSEGISGLGAAERAGVDERFAELSRLESLQPPPRHYVCPLLDAKSGACLVYAHRPAACRTYGFYLTGGQGLFCAQIVEALASRDSSPVIWGSQEGIEAALFELSGESRSLTCWITELPPG